LPDIGHQRRHDQHGRGLRRRHHQRQQPDRNRWQAETDHALDEAGQQKRQANNDRDRRRPIHDLDPVAGKRQIAGEARELEAGELVASELVRRGNLSCARRLCIDHHQERAHDLCDRN
jgi:hypothetical protein